MTREPLTIGSVVEVKPAFWHDGTEEQADEISWCEATVLAIHGDDTADVQVRNGGEWNVWVGRLRTRRAA